MSSDSQKCPIFWWISHCWSLPGPSEAACGPLGREDVYGRQLHLPAWFSAGTRHQDHPGVLKKRKYGEILDPGRLAAIFAKAEPAGLLHLQHLAGKIPWNASHQSSLLAWVYHQEPAPAITGLHLPDLPLIPPLLGSCHGKKRRQHWIAGLPRVWDTQTKYIYKKGRAKIIFSSATCVNKGWPWMQLREDSNVKSLSLNHQIDWLL